MQWLQTKSSEAGVGARLNYVIVEVGLRADAPLVVGAAARELGRCDARGVPYPPGVSSVPKVTASKPLDVMIFGTMPFETSAENVARSS